VAGGAPLAVVFADASSGNFTSRSWNFGDGTGSTTTATSISHTYAAPGAYTASLTVTGPQGNNTSAGTAIVVALSTDTVGDGIPDWWRSWYFGLAGTEADAASDPDQDGEDNFHEYLADTNPLDPGDNFHILDFSAHNNPTVLPPPPRTRQYTLYYSNNLASGVWTPVPSQTGAPGSGGLDSLADPSPKTSARFYIVQPGPLE
jgi:PKD repeat protein